MMRLQEKLCEFFVPFVVEEQIVGYVHKKLVQMNGYVERDGKKYLWLAKRRKVKPTFPGKLDEMGAGGQTVIDGECVLHEEPNPRNIFEMRNTSYSIQEPPYMNNQCTMIHEFLNDLLSPTHQSSKGLQTYIKQVLYSRNQ